MNRVILMGRLTKDPEVRYAQRENQMLIARYTLAVDRRKRNGAESETDFIPCVAFGRTAEIAEKYLKKGTKVAVSGRIQTGSYINQDGRKVYTTDVVIDGQEFAESKKQTDPSQSPLPNSLDDFISVPDDISDEGLPFN